MKQRTKLICIGTLTGFANGLFGSGGGMILVPSLLKQKLTQHKAQATAMAVILPITAISAIIYAFKTHIGTVAFLAAFGALPGGATGAWLMGKLKPVWLSRIFAAFALFAGIRIFLA